MYIKCTRVASKRGITDDGRHAESRCTRLYLLLREKENSCRARIAMRFAFSLSLSPSPPPPPLPPPSPTREREFVANHGRKSIRSLTPSGMCTRCAYACVTCRVFGEIGIGEDRVWPACKKQYILFLLRQSCSV